jgi:hypothetical protein
MTLCYQSYWYLTPRVKCYRAPEDPLAQPYAFGVMVDAAVSHVANDLLGGVDELLDVDVILWRAAPLLARGDGVVPTIDGLLLADLCTSRRDNNGSMLTQSI